MWNQIRGRKKKLAGIIDINSFPLAFVTFIIHSLTDGNEGKNRIKTKKKERKRT